MKGMRTSIRNGETENTTKTISLDFQNNLGIQACINICNTKLLKISKLFLKEIHVSRFAAFRKWEIE